jgi:signal transduction histidine kinase
VFLPPYSHTFAPVTRVLPNGRERLGDRTGSGAKHLLLLRKGGAQGTLACFGPDGGRFRSISDIRPVICGISGLSYEHAHRREPPILALCRAGKEDRSLPTEDRGHELLLRELGRINSELATQRRLSAMTVHDLSNPAQVILGLSELLMEHETIDPVVRRRLEQMHRSALTMSAMISDLSAGLALDDQVEMQSERLNLVELVASVVDRSRVLASAKDMRLLLFTEQSDEEGCWIVGDAVKLERALVNLLGNAIKFSPRSSTVSVALDRGYDHAKIAVHDQGPGISDEGHARIFEAFHREEQTAHLPGQGLGLFITKQIAESHGGSLTVDSQPGRGATFLLEVPLSLDEPLAGLG